MSNAFVRSIKTPKYSSYFQKILKFHLRDRLSHGQLNVFSENQTAFYIKYNFQKRI